MPVLKRRTRIVSFRLSEEEYEALMRYCVAHGARSISDYARIVACRPHDHTKSGAAARKSERSIRQLRNRVEELDRIIQQLTIQIDHNRLLEGEPGRMDRPDLNDPPPPPPASAQRRLR